MRFLIPAILLLATAAALAQDAPPPEIPVIPGVETVHSELGDWFAAGSRPRDYQLGFVRTPGAVGEEAFIIRAKPDAQQGYSGFATMMQMHPPGEYQGKRVRLSARVKTESARCAQIWMRVDPKGRYAQGQPARPLAFYNMDDRLIHGTTDWKRYEVVLDVSDQAGMLAWGFTLIGGKGTVWADSFALEIVDENVPVSVMRASRSDC